MHIFGAYGREAGYDLYRVIYVCYDTGPRFSRSLPRTTIIRLVRQVKDIDQNKTMQLKLTINGKTIKHIRMCSTEAEKRLKNSVPV